ncbi:PAS domain S-box protein [Candidatus Uhrbacteria bacterium]|nr:PAS domain S-box protein [Candidatus Uhrbacteria bacterium]
MITKNTRANISTIDQILCEDRFSELVINSLPGVFYIFDAKGKFILWNKTFEKVTGYSKKEIAQSSPVDYFLKSEKKLVTSSISRALNSGKAEVEALFVSKNGKQTPYLFNENRIVIGKKKYVAGLGIDRSEAKEFQDKLRKSEYRSRTLMYNSPFSIELYDSDGNWLEGNKAWEKLWNLKPSDARGKFNILKDKQAKKKGIDKYFRKALKGETVALPDLFYSAEEAVGTGKSRWLRSSFYSINGDPDKTVYVVVTHVDITEKKEHEHKLAESEEMHRLLYEKASGAIMLLKPPTCNFVEGNKAAIKLFGLSNDKQFSALKLWDVSPKYQPDGQLSSVKGKKFIRRALKEGQCKFEWTHKKPKGDIFSVEVQLDRIKLGDEIFLQARVQDISKRKIDEQELHDAKNLFEDIAKSSGDWLWETDVAGNYTYASGKVKKILGYTAKEVIGISPFNFMSKEEAVRTSKIFSKLSKEKKPIVNLEHIEISTDGKPVHILTNGVPILNVGGDLVGYRGFNTDISIKIHSKMEDQIDIRNYGLISKVGMMLNEPDHFESRLVKAFGHIGEVLSINKIAKFRVDHDTNLAYEIVSWTLHGNKHVDKKPKKIKYTKAVSNIILKKNLVNSRSKKNLKSETFDFFRDANYRSAIALPGRPISKSDSFIVFNSIERHNIWNYEEINVLKILVDMISLALERETIRIQIVNERNKLQRTLFAMSDGVIVLGKDLIVTDFNHAAETMTMVRATDIIGKSFNKEISLVKINDPEKKDILILEHMISGTIRRRVQKTAIKTAKGKIIPIGYNTTPLHGSDDVITGHVIVFRDITAEQEADKVKNEFVSVASHQLRTPLTGVKWLTEVLVNSDKQELNVQQLQMIKEIRERNEDMIKLVSDLLNVSRMDADEVLDLTYSRSDMKGIIKSIIKENTLLAAKNGNKVNFITSDKDNKILVEIDSSRMKEAIKNAVDNAIKYSRKKGEVTIRASQTEKNVLIQIQDKGYGIPERQQHRVFDKFFRADNAIKLQTSGTGLGLYITKTIVDAHGGKIWVTSKLGEGTTVHIQLPKTHKKN